MKSIPWNRFQSSLNVYKFGLCTLGSDSLPPLVVGTRPGRFWASVANLCHAVFTKGVGHSTTLACPGWEQPDISVKVDWHDLKQAGSRKVV
jgi:hypothetical protein